MNVSAKHDLVICIPTWNRADLIGPAIESLLAQTDPEFDIVVFDNASTDATPEVVARYPRVRYVQAETNTGYIGNLNRCLSLARQYQWIGILHSDDVLTPHAVAQFRARRDAAPEAQLIFGGQHQIDVQGRITARHQGPARTYRAGDEALLRSQSHIPCSGTFYGARAIAAVGEYSSEFPYSADEEYATRIAARFDLAECGEAVACYRRHAGHTMIGTWRKADFIASFQAMRLRMNRYLSPRAQRTDQAVIEEVASTLLDHCSGLIAHKEYRIAYRFYRHALRRAPRLLIRPKTLLRLGVHITPGVGPIVCRALSRNAG